MYIPKRFEETDTQVLHALMKAQPLAAWVTSGPTGLLVDHIPFLVVPGDGQHGTLVGHVARANPVWQSCSREIESVVVFQGPQTYITPSWYPTKQDDGKVVPTWNYAVVHAHGLPRICEERKWLLNHVSQLTDEHEARQALPWSVSDAPADFMDTLLGGIVGIEIPISRIFGKWKASQNRSAADRLGTVAGLQARDDEVSSEMGDLVARYAKHAP